MAGVKSFKVILRIGCHPAKLLIMCLPFPVRSEQLFLLLQTELSLCSEDQVSHVQFNTSVPSPQLPQTMFCVPFSPLKALCHPSSLPPWCLQTRHQFPVHCAFLENISQTNSEEDVLYMNLIWSRFNM